NIVAAIADTVVVDLEARFDDERTLSVLELASLGLVVVPPEIGALRNARRLLDLAPKMGLDVTRFRLVLNRVSDRAGLSPQDISSVLPVDQIEKLPDIG